MKLMISTAAIALAAISMPAAAQSSAPQSAASQQGAQKPVKVSSKAAKAISDLQTSVNKGDYSKLAAQVAAAQAVASTPDDRYAIGELELKAAVAQKNDAAMAAGVDAVANSGFIDAAEKSKLYASLGTTFYNSKQYDQAAAAFQKSVAADPRNAQGYTLLGEAKFAQGQKAEAASDFQHAVQIQTASGQKPDEALLKRAVTVAYDAQSPLAVELAREWASAYPSADSWRNSIAIYRNLDHPDEEGTLDLLRLMQATGSMNAGDYALFAEAAADQGNYNEAQSVIDAGIAAHVVDPASTQFRDIVSGLKGKQKATAADLAAAAKMSPTSANLLRIGDRYYGMGNYAQAADIYRQVLSKPDADKDVANLHLGIALARAGDKAGAMAALNAVGGGRAEIAKFWLAYLQQHA